VAIEETLLVPRTIESQDVVYQDRNQTIRRVVAVFDGFEKEYFVSDHGIRAAIVALRQDAVLLTRQYRLLPNRVSLEIPGGRVDPGESPRAAAVRECFEETGVRCRKVVPLLEFHSGVDIWLNYTYLYVSRTCEVTDTVPSDRRVFVEMEECLDMVFTGKIIDMLSITAILGLHARRTLR
jgi:ADP-ribose pyrophosphatase